MMKRMYGQKKKMETSELENKMQETCESDDGNTIIVLFLNIRFHILDRTRTYLIYYISPFLGEPNSESYNMAGRHFWRRGQMKWVNVKITGNERWVRIQWSTEMISVFKVGDFSLMIIDNMVDSCLYLFKSVGCFHLERCGRIMSLMRHAIACPWSSLI